MSISGLWVNKTYKEYGIDILLITCKKISDFPLQPCFLFQTSADQASMTVVNIKGWGSSLKDLDKYILMALFKCKLPSYIIEQCV